MALRSGPLAFVVAAVVGSASSVALADPNHPEQGTASCAPHTTSTSRSSSSRRSRSAGENVAGTIIGAILQGIFSGGDSSSESSSEPEVEEARPTSAPLMWPSEVGIRISGGVGSLDFGPAAFVDDDSPLQLLGTALHIGRMELAGGELAIDYAPVRAFRTSIGGGYFGPIGGDDGTFTSRRVSSDGVSVISAFVEAGFVQRVGVFDAFAVAHAGLLAAEIDVDDTCGCTRTYRTFRFTLGPHLGLRAFLAPLLFVQASLFMDAVQLPDYVASIGLGFGRRAL